MRIVAQTNVLHANDTRAARLRDGMTRAGVLVVNITSAPGSGKTALLERTIPALAPLRSAVIVGDLQTDRDAERIARATEVVKQVNTEGGCHLSADQVERALAPLDLEDIDVLFIENIGTMVCPAGYDLGEHRRVAMVSAPEGPDKVAKYPTLFQPADAVILSKRDLWEVLEFDAAVTHEDLDRLNTRAPRFALSSRTGDGMDAWLRWLRDAHAQLLKRSGGDDARAPGPP